MSTLPSLAPSIIMTLVALNMLPAGCGASTVWTGGSGVTKVEVASDGSYAVSVGGGQQPWLSGSANTSAGSLPMSLHGVRTVQGEQGRLGAFTGAEIQLSTAALATTPPAAVPANCGPLEQDKDYHGNDIKFVPNITDPAQCCALCVAEKACAGFSLMGAADTGTAWARRCYLKSSMVHGSKFKTHISAKVPGRAPAPAPPGPPPGPPTPPLPPGTVILLTLTIKYFSALDLFLFEQLWPDGLDLQYTSHTGLAAAFPHFELTAKGPASELSGITWSGEMSGGSVCHAGGSAPCAAMGGHMSKAASGFGEGADAPLVLLQPNSSGLAVVLSAFDMWGHQRLLAAGGAVGWGPDLSVAPAAKALPKGYNSSVALHGCVRCCACLSFLFCT